MVLSIDHSTLVISVPQADLTLITGSLYELDTETVFRQGVIDLLDDEQGIVLEDAIVHNTEVTVAGTTFARTIEVINGYSVTFTPDSQYTVRLAGSNNNIFDVENSILNQNQVQLISQNSAGLIQISTGSGLSAAQDTKLTEVHGELRSIEGGEHHSWLMRIFLAALGNILAGAATTTLTMRDKADTKDRITATVDADGNRSAVTLDGD